MPVNFAKCKRIGIGRKSAVASCMFVADDLLSMGTARYLGATILLK